MSEDMNRHRYDNMLNLPRPRAQKPMSIHSRAAQFSPFAALTGYEDKVRETARLTKDEIFLTDSSEEILDQKMQILGEHISDCYTVEVSYYIPDSVSHIDSNKNGGDYEKHCGFIKRIDSYNRLLVFEDGKEVCIDRIVEIESDIFESKGYD